MEHKTEEINLANVEKPDRKIIPRGTYKALVDEVSVQRKDGKDYDSIAIFFLFTENEIQGVDNRRLTIFSSTSEGALPYLLEALENIGADIDFSRPFVIDENDCRIIGRQVEIDVYHKSGSKSWSGKPESAIGAIRSLTKKVTKDDIHGDLIKDVGMYEQDDKNAGVEIPEAVNL